jgi:2-methylcitrate dehydratase PrpD
MTVRPITSELAALSVQSSYASLPEHIRRETARTFLNIVGCMLGGSQDAPVRIALEAAREAGGNPQATVLGHKDRANVATAAMINCLSASALAYDDTHLATVTHPTGPVAGALLAYAETAKVSGEEFVNALALGVEIQCRMSNVLLMPPAKANLSLYVTGLTGPIGTAAALARLMKLDAQKTSWAIGLASAQAAGFRGTHGAMSGIVVPAFGARDAVSATMLAARGFGCPENILESEKGFVNIFTSGANLDLAVERWGEHFELMRNAYKPYPCGIVLHPMLDACLEIAAQLPPGAQFASVKVIVHPLTIVLGDRRAPRDEFEGQVSIYHWAAAALLRRAAGIAEMRQSCLDDPAVIELRNRVEAVGDASLGRAQAIAEVELTDGTKLRSRIEVSRGSAERPLTDADLDLKFRTQANMVVSPDVTERLLRFCRDIAKAEDVGKEFAAALAG